MRSTSTATGLQCSDVCGDGPPIFRLNLRGVASHHAETICYHLVKIAEPGLSQTIFIKRRGLFETATDNLAVAITILLVTYGAINVVAFAAALEDLLR